MNRRGHRCILDTVRLLLGRLIAERSGDGQSDRSNDCEEHNESCCGEASIDKHKKGASVTDVVHTRRARDALMGLLRLNSRLPMRSTPERGLSTHEADGRLDFGSALHLFNSGGREEYGAAPLICKWWSGSLAPLGGKFQARAARGAIAMVRGKKGAGTQPALRAGRARAGSHPSQSSTRREGKATDQPVASGSAT